ncbi:hypothetical protein JAAARDRAFT_210575 [Jaapia argillacea MUCL 33604]|uniref:Uncharacterized protein n=1 Tax=Jaapia argillacea MUCL 33604 TaxID=933084 RepID=A0A067PBU8_9AGAM|nr:hypothetical protein JAAARDRAFT_210575 [Jaapia argillacea MUCL 33604]
MSIFIDSLASDTSLRPTTRNSKFVLSLLNVPTTPNTITQRFLGPCPPFPLPSPLPTSVLSIPSLNFLPTTLANYLPDLVAPFLLMFLSGDEQKLREAEVTTRCFVENGPVDYRSRIAGGAIMEEDQDEDQVEEMG